MKVVFIHSETDADADADGNTHSFLSRNNKLNIIRHGLGVRIAGSHPAGPGSIPGVGNKLFSQ